MEACSRQNGRSALAPSLPKRTERAHVTTALNAALQVMEPVMHQDEPALRNLVVPREILVGEIA